MPQPALALPQARDNARAEPARAALETLVRLVVIMMKLLGFWRAWTEGDRDRATARSWPRIHVASTSAAAPVSRQHGEEGGQVRGAEFAELGSRNWVRGTGRARALQDAAGPETPM